VGVVVQWPSARTVRIDYVHVNHIGIVSMCYLLAFVGVVEMVRPTCLVSSLIRRTRVVGVGRRMCRMSRVCCAGRLLTHYCWKLGCCEGQKRDICCGRMIALLNKTVFSTLGTDLPSKTRFYTYLPHLCKQALGMVAEEILFRTAQASYATGPSGNIDADSYHGHCNAKKTQSLDFLSGGASTTMNMVLTAVYGLPMDILSLTVQKHDAKDGGMKLMLDQRVDKNPIHKSMRQLWSTWAFWEPPVDSSSQSPLAALLSQFGVQDDAVMAAFFDESRIIAVSFGAALFMLELRYSLPILKWLGSHELPEHERRAADQAFFDTKICDRDKYASAPFLSRIEHVDKLRTPDLQSFRDALRNELKGANMGMESLLAEVRAALPRGKQWASAEGQCHLPYLGQLLKTHLAKKRPHPSADETRETLLQEGVSVELRPPKRWARPDNISAQCEQSACAPAVDAQARASDDVALAPAEPTPPIQDDACWPGDAELPAKEQIVKDYAYASSMGSGRCAEGLANKAKSIRQENASRLVVFDDGGIPREKFFDIHLCCLEMHPGLCMSEDADVYQNSIMLARSLENCLHNSLLYKLILLKDADTNRGKMFFISRVRRRQTFYQVTHVLAACERQSDGTWMLKSREDSLGWDFRTLWTVAKTILRQGWPRINAVELTWTSHRNGTMSVSNNAVHCWEVWPSIFKRPKAERDDGPQVYDAEKKAPTARRGGVRVKGPTGTSDVEHHVDGEDGDHSEDEDSTYDIDIEPEHIAPAVPPAPLAPGPPAPVPVPAAPEPEENPDGAAAAASDDPPPPPRWRCPPGERSYTWGRGHKIAKIVRDEVQVGWGLTCGYKHRDVAGLATTACKIQLTYGSGDGALHDDECLLRLKRWAQVDLAKLVLS
jgi:hypothetical protein